MKMSFSLVTSLQLLSLSHTHTPCQAFPKCLNDSWSTETTSLMAFSNSKLLSWRLKQGRERGILFWRVQEVKTGICEWNNRTLLGPEIITSRTQLDQTLSRLIFSCFCYINAHFTQPIIILLLANVWLCNRVHLIKAFQVLPEMTHWLFGTQTDDTHWLNQPALLRKPHFQLGHGRSTHRRASPHLPGFCLDWNQHKSATSMPFLRPGLPFLFLPAQRSRRWLLLLLLGQLPFIELSSPP